MTFKICGSKTFRAFTDRNREKFYIENLQNRGMFEIRVENWDDFYNIVQTVDRNIKKKRKEGS